LIGGSRRNRAARLQGLPLPEPDRVEVLLEDLLHGAAKPLRGVADRLRVASCERVELPGGEPATDGASRDEGRSG
jgi:hypothetical protein